MSETPDTTAWKLPDSWVPLSGVTTAAILECVIPHFPFVVPGRFKDGLQIEEAKLWCVEQFGESARVESTPPDKKFAYRFVDTERFWCSTRRYFVFKDADSAFAFKMRWG